MKQKQVSSPGTVLFITSFVANKQPQCKVRSQDESYVSALCAWCLHLSPGHGPQRASLLTQNNPAWTELKCSSQLTEVCLTFCRKMLHGWKALPSHLSLAPLWQFLNSFPVCFWRAHAVHLIFCVFISTVVKITDSETCRVCYKMFWQHLVSFCSK